MPVRATNNAMPQGSSVNLTFSPSRIPLGYASTLSITVGAEGVGTDLYVLVSIQFQDWLRWQTSEIKMGNFLYGGVVYKPDNQLLNSNFLQIAVVVPKGDSKTILVPVLPTRVGTLYLSEVQVLTLAVVNGSFVLTPDGSSYQGLTISILQFPSRLEVYDPALKQIADNQQQTLDKQNQALGLLQNDVPNAFSALATALQGDFGHLSNQTAALANQQRNELQAQYYYIREAFYILLGLSILILLYLFWFTYRMRPKPS